MKFRIEMEIDAPRAKVVDLWCDPSRLRNWQEGFLGKTLVEGEEGKKGAVSRIRYANGRRVMEIQETILQANLPDLHVAAYEHFHMDNTLSTQFQEIPGGKTRQISEVEYTRFKGLMPRMMVTFFPRMFRVQQRNWMENFKKLAEGNVDE